MAPKDGGWLEQVEKRFKEKKTHVSFPQLKYPSLRDDGLRDPYQWLDGKVLDDGAEGLWRVNDGLYDLSRFIDKHPGGSDWLIFTKGTDITEAFEVHHLNPIAEDLLKKFYIRKANTSRNSPFTFKENDFYKTLKKIIREELKRLPHTIQNESDTTVTLLFLGILLFTFGSCYVNGLLSVLCMVFAALCIAFLTIASHNYFHKKDNWRMYLFNFSMMSFREWRISHALSHHLYTNTLMDLEISSFDYVFPWLPRGNKGVYPMIAVPIQFITFPLLFHIGFIRKILKCYLNGNNARQLISWSDIIPFTLPLFIWITSGVSLIQVLQKWSIIIMGSSFLFFLIGFNAAHHHPDIFHDGDQVLDSTIDWGIHTLETVMDRREITGSPFLVLTQFGDHALHHLFPTVDHAYLKHIYPVFLEHCSKYKARFRMTSSFDLFIGQLKQMCREKPTLLE